jgi:hypothetical protein
MRRTLILVSLVGASLISIYGGSSAVGPSQSGGPNARADFDGDGFSDLAIGVPGESIGAVSNAGAVHVLYGSPNGISTADAQFWHQDSPGIAGDPEDFDQFGESVAAGDFDGDGRADLAIGVQAESVGESLGTVSDAGAVYVLYGSATGLQSLGSQVWHQDSPGIGESAEEFDVFGWAVAAANLGRSGHADLAIGVPGEDLDTLNGAGVAHVLYGSANGLRSQGSQVLHQDRAGIADVPEAGDNFGSGFATANYGRTSHADLAVGVPFEDLASMDSAGAIHVLYGSPNGVRPQGSQFWHQGRSGVADDPEDSDWFGAGLAGADFGRSGQADLALGAPGDPVAGQADAGIVHVLYGSPDGLRAQGSQHWHQNSPGVADDAEVQDWFGMALAAGDLGKSEQADLIVGAVAEGLGVVDDAGAVHVLYGSPDGVRSQGAQLWHQDSLDVTDSAETNDEFGRRLAVGSFGRGGRSDLAIGVPREAVGAMDDAGASHVLYGSPTGLSAAQGAQFWNQDSSGVVDEAEQDDDFAWGLFDGDQID